MNILVTGAAGFIGFHLCKKLLESGHNVIGIDNLNNYYSVQLKKDRIIDIQTHDRKISGLEKSNFYFHNIDITDFESLNDIFKKNTINSIVHLAAQAGVRYSLVNPRSFIDSNIMGFFNTIELAKEYNVNHFYYASSSSVYGLNSKIPFSVQDRVDNPANLYAATKKSNELFAHSYSSLYKLPTTGLRFFTVYGPWGRPDMSYFLFSKAILNGDKINIFNNGSMMRDFTYIDDIITAILKLLSIDYNMINSDVKKKQNENEIPYRVLNIGRGNPTNLLTFIEILETEFGITAEKIFLPMQAGDMENTYADTQELYNLIDFKPQISLKEGINKFVNWYKEYFSI